jgi:hypothetical protein
VWACSKCVECALLLLLHAICGASRFSPRRQEQEQDLPAALLETLLARPVVRLMFARYHDNIMTAQTRRACGELWIHTRPFARWLVRPQTHTQKASKSNPFVYCANKKQTLLDFQQRAPGSQILHHAPSCLRTAGKVLAFALCWTHTFAAAPLFHCPNYHTLARKKNNQRRK